MEAIVELNVCARAADRDALLEALREIQRRIDAGHDSSACDVFTFAVTEPKSRAIARLGCIDSP